MFLALTERIGDHGCLLFQFWLLEGEFLNGCDDESVALVKVSLTKRVMREGLAFGLPPASVCG